MQLDDLLKCTLVFLLACLTGPILNSSQEKTSNSPATSADSSTYSNTANGLEQLIQAMLDAAKGNDSQKLATLLKETEIPNCGVWLHTMYESGSADSWMGLCDAAELGANEKSMAQRLSSLAKEDGELLIRKVNDNPEPGRGMEWGWLQSIRQPLDIYFASWKIAKATRAEPIGYFMFVEGGFRWDSGIRFEVPRISNFKFVPAKLIRKVDPIYPPEAAAQKIRGTVRMNFDIGADGVVRNVHVISGEGLSSDPSLCKAAEDAVKKWRFAPAMLDGKPAEFNGKTADITFSPGN